MDDRKQYAKKVVVNVIHLMAMASSGLLSKEEAIRLFDEIPEDLHKDIMSALMAARMAKKVGMIAKLASIFPMEDILKEAMEEAEKSQKD